MLVSIWHTRAEKLSGGIWIPTPDSTYWTSCKHLLRPLDSCSVDPDMWRISRAKTFLEKFETKSSSANATGHRREVPCNHTSSFPINFLLQVFQPFSTKLFNIKWNIAPSQDFEITLGIMESPRWTCYPPSTAKTIMTYH